MRHLPPNTSHQPIPSEVTAIYLSVSPTFSRFIHLTTYYTHSNIHQSSAIILYPYIPREGYVRQIKIHTVFSTNIASRLTKFCIFCVFERFACLWYPVLPAPIIKILFTQGLACLINMCLCRRSKIGFTFVTEV
jgi:hypothetical protein